MDWAGWGWTGRDGAGKGRMGPHRVTVNPLPPGASRTGSTGQAEPGKDGIQVCQSEAAKDGMGLDLTGWDQTELDPTR